MKHPEETKPETPALDERGFELITTKRVFPTLSNADLAARAQFYAAMRAMKDEEFHAGRGFTYAAMVRDDPGRPARLIRYVFGLRPRVERTYAEMEKEAVEVIAAAHKAFAREG